MKRDLYERIKAMDEMDVKKRFATICDILLSEHMSGVKMTDKDKLKKIEEETRDVIVGGMFKN
ncbi:hypothetical protein QUH70_00995 [Staphylococcus felis]|uniref:hypothetical protein n=1 Tax=Staphylococcus felis TaxID=46127 RepID=UPI0025A459D2|nr:hypothetical protein [Staphylococcus felis]MDM8326722.1 hypothetical protein [Staphylococcus felis]